MVTQPTQVQGLRTRNRRAILAAIRNLGQTARVDIARDTGISAATVTSITADLVEEGLVEETMDPAAARGGGRGRPRVLLRIRPDAFLIGGAKISTDHITIMLTDYAGAEVLHHVCPLPIGPGLTAEKVAGHLETATASALERLGRKPEELASIGVGLPGFVDASTGIVHWSACFPDRGINFHKLLARGFGCPVYLDNDANVVALAEKWFGFGRGVDDFLVVTIEHGVGLGVVIGGQIFRGARGIGTEFGHTKVEFDGALCRCGQRGCLEAYVADYALAREAAFALDRDLALPVTPQEELDALFAAAKAGDEVADSIFRRAGRIFAMGLANLANIFDPGLIIFSGEQMRFDYLYSPEVLDQMRRLSVASGRTPPKMRVHKWGDRIWARGAAALAMEGLNEQAHDGGPAVAAGAAGPERAAVEDQASL